MKSKNCIIQFRFAATAMACAGVLVLNGVFAAWSQTTRVNQPIAAEPTPKKPKLLIWDSVEKEMAPIRTSGLAGGVAQFVFNVTNVSDQEVVIERTVTSCGCTTVRMPAQPWHLAPHEAGHVDVALTYAGKSGIFQKTIDVVSSNAPEKLTVKINLGAMAQMERAENRAEAAKNRQAVFKGDCATCHADKAKGKMGKELYIAACGICHEATHRATMVPNLHALNKATNYDYWKEWISNGKTNSLMPAFATAAGGPLTDEQIDSLAKTLAVSLPSRPGNGASAKH